MLNSYEPPKKPELSPEQIIIADELIQVLAKHDMSYLEALKFLCDDMQFELIYRYSQVSLPKI